jgi:hypothetical protein
MLDRRAVRSSTLDYGPAQGSSFQGGITNLSLRGVPIELKVADAPMRAVDNCAQFTAQAASCAVAKSKRMAILSVLAASVKRAAPVPAETLPDIRD